MQIMAYYPDFADAGNYPYLFFSSANAVAGRDERIELQERRGRRGTGDRQRAVRSGGPRRGAEDRSSRSPTRRSRWCRSSGRHRRWRSTTTTSSPATDPSGTTCRGRSADSASGSGSGVMRRAAGSTAMTAAALVRFVLCRLALAAPLLLITSFGVFALVHLAPGDPVRALLGTRPSDPETLAALRARHHLDDPFIVQYGKWLWQVLQGDLGRSINGNRRVAAHHQRARRRHHTARADQHAHRARRRHPPRRRGGAQAGTRGSIAPR